jgi:hypothetical protein
MQTNEARAIKILQEIIDKFKALVDAQDEEIKRLRAQVFKLEKIILEKEKKDV